MGLLISIIIAVAIIAAVLGFQLVGSSDKAEQMVRRLRHRRRYKNLWKPTPARSCCATRA